ncbi:helix-turn-helix domain-containing protein [Collinsella stercoris]|uniref:helix-turn-helix domain-containing protein n=1 Tax=Collinsella stercoris TaxID=147206 RepID=UPI003A932FCA
MTGRNICSERHRLGLTQLELADRIGVSVNAVSAWENGSFEPNSNSLKKLSQLFSCSTDYLLGLTDERTVAVIR